MYFVMDVLFVSTACLIVKQIYQSVLDHFFSSAKDFPYLRSKVIKGPPEEVGSIIG